MAEATSVNVTILDDENVVVNLNVQNEAHAVNINVTELDPYIINIMFGEGIPNLQQVSEVGNITNRVLQHAPATQNQHSATLGQVKDEVDDLYQWILNQSFLTAGNLSGYATQQWVLDRGYITVSALAGYATETWVNNQGFLKSADLDGYATESWVLDRNYITADALNGYATEDWVNDQGFLKAVDLDGYATETWVLNQEYLQASDLIGYATETWVQDQDYATETWVLDQLKPKGKLISFSVLVTSSTTGLVSSRWIDYNGINRQVINSPVAFIGLPGTGNFRYDLIQGLNNGTVVVKTGTEGLINAIVRPSAEPDKVSLGYILWSHTGEIIIVDPEPIDVFPSIRYQTQVAPDTTGKYAKVCDFNLTPSNNYQVVIHYANPVNFVTNTKGSLGSVLIGFTCDPDGNISSPTVRLETVGSYADVGEFTLIQKTTVLAELYHKGNHFWSRIEYGFPFFGSTFSIANIYNNQPYDVLPAYSQIFESQISDIRDHNLFNNLQGGTTLERYHLTLAELEKLQNLDQVPLSDGLIAGGVVVWSGTGYTYFISQALVRFNGILYLVPAGEVTLTAADPTLDRVDTIYVTATAFGFITGTPAVDPIEPQVEPASQIRLTTVDVAAGSTTPVGPTKQVIYREATGGEFARSFFGSGTAEFTNTEFPTQGSFCIKASALQNGSTIRMDYGSAFDASQFGSVSMQLRLRATLGGAQNVAFQFRDASLLPVGNLINIPLNKDLINQYQFIAVAMVLFGLDRQVRYLDFVFRRGSGSVTHTGLYIDDWVLEGGTIPAPSGTIQLTNEVSGTGNTGTPIQVSLTERAISNRTLHAVLTGTEQILARLTNGTLVKINASSLFSAGEDGREVEIRNSGTHIQWRYVGDVGWIDIVALIDLKGDDGVPVELRQSGTFIQWKYIDEVSWINLFDLSTLDINGLPNGGTVGQVLTKNSSTDGDASWQDPTGGGGGLELIPFSTVINITGNFKSVHTQTGAIAITKGSFPTPASNFENKTVQLITANGTGGKPTFTSDFVLQMDTWSNNTGDINQLIYKGSPSGKILVWMDNVELA